MSSLSIVVPVYKEEKNVPEFLRRMVPVLEGITPNYEILFVMDPSPDRTEDVIQQARRANPRVKLLRFSRRIGQPMATLAGLEFSAGDAVVVIDVDLQDPPELIAEMFRMWKDGSYDVVYAQRRTRTGESWLKKLIAYTGYWVIAKISDVPIPRNTGDFRLMSRRVVREVTRLRESHGFLRGMVAYVGFRQGVVQFDRAPRNAGKGNYNRFFGSLRIGLNGLVCFSTRLLSLSSLFGFGCAVLSILGGLGYLIAKLQGVPFPLGNPTVVILVLFLSGVQLLCIGLLGEYVGRIYEDVRQRPRYILDAAFGFDEGSASARGSSLSEGNRHEDSHHGGIDRNRRGPGEHPASPGA